MCKVYFLGMEFIIGFMLFWFVYLVGGCIEYNIILLGGYFICILYFIVFNRVWFLFVFIFGFYIVKMSKKYYKK